MCVNLPYPIMEIVIIQKDCLYAAKYDGETYDEYNRIFEEHGNRELVENFFEIHKWEIGQYYVSELGLSRDEVDAYTQRVVEEAEDFEDYFENLIDNTIDGVSPGISSNFVVLEGFEKEVMPAMKSYGLSRPSMLRVYAIEVSINCLIIFYSGIKIAHSIGESPVLKDNVIPKARRIIAFLEENDITSKEDLNAMLIRKGI